MSEPNTVREPTLADDEYRFRALTALEDLRFRIRDYTEMFGAKRSLNEALGHPDSSQLNNAKYRELYEREGLAHRALKFGPQMLWGRGFSIVEDEDPDTETGFERSVNELIKALNVHAVFFKADVLASMAQYSVIRLTFDDVGQNNVTLKDPVTAGAQLVQMLPVHQDNANILTTVTNANDPRVGYPEHYNIATIDANTSKKGKAEKVHYTRVLHFTRLTLDDPLRGLPVYKPVYNLFQNLIKVSGGGSEAFWRSVYRVMHLNATDPEATRPPQKVLDELDEQLEEMVHHMRSHIKTIGMDITSHGATPVDFSNQVETILKQIAGTFGYPWRQFLGSEQAQLASSADRISLNNRIDEDIFIYAESAAREFVNRLAEIGTVERPRKTNLFGQPVYEIDWHREMEHTPEERAKMAYDMARANKANSESGGGLIMTGDEIRSDFLDAEALDEKDAFPEPPEPEEPAEPSEPFESEEEDD